MDLRAVIMAGGIGTRFWPLSRKRRPKQFLPIISEKSMVEETVARIQDEIPPSHIYTIADLPQTDTLKRFLPQLPARNFLIEPEGRNTAPCLMLSTAAIYRDNPEAVIAVLPADHLIQQPRIFLEKLMAGAEAAVHAAALITFGIPPLFPATGYGYIQFHPDESRQIGGEKFFAVAQFKEKPDRETAEEFLKAGNYRWNSGMFLWQAQGFVAQLAQHAPELHSFWDEINACLDAQDDDRLAGLYSRLPATSIDYALIERAENVWMAEGDFGWSDVGAWSALADFWPQDKDANAIRGDHVLLGTDNCLVYNPKKLTALIGVKDLIVVETADALLICRKDQDQSVKDIVKHLRDSGRDDFL